MPLDVSVNTEENSVVLFCSFPVGGSRHSFWLRENSLGESYHTLTGKSLMTVFSD